MPTISYSHTDPASYPPYSLARLVDWIEEKALSGVFRGEEALRMGEETFRKDEKVLRKGMIIDQ